MLTKFSILELKKNELVNKFVSITKESSPLFIKYKTFDDLKNSFDLY